MEQKKTKAIARSENIGRMHSDRPNIGDEHIMDGRPCYVIDVNDEGAWFGRENNIPRIHRWIGSFRKFGSPDYPKKA
jgi:hypothetical protein